MKRSSMYLMLLYGVLLIVGCSGRMISLSETEYSRPIHGLSDKDQIKEAIVDGIKNAGWVVEAHSSGIIQAAYQIRIHTVQVNIFYSDTAYDIRYSSSIAMKMYCSERDKKKGKHIVSGIENCPGNLPYYINANYKAWVDSLASAIESSLANKQ